MSPISEDELRARLRGVEPSPAQSGFAEHVIHQGRARRRRQRWLTAMAAAAAVVAIGGGAFVISDQLGRETALPATPTPTPTQAESAPTVTSTKSPSASPTPSPTSTPSTSTKRATSTPSPSSTPSRSATLTPVTFLHEGVKGDGETTSDWETTTEVTGPCGLNAWSLAGQHGATESRALRGGGGDGGATGEALFVFADADAAVAFMGQLRELTRTCEATTNGESRGLVESLEGPWGEGIAFTSLPNEPTVGGGPVGLAVRGGRAVAMSTSAGPFSRTDQVHPGLVASARPGVEHLYPQLCRYTRAGC
jgi:hypothetical protein